MQHVKQALLVRVSLNDVHMHMQALEATSRQCPPKPSPG